MSRAVQALSLCALCMLACSESPVQPTDGGDEFIVLDKDASVPPSDAAPRLLPHDQFTLASMQLGVVYLSDVDAGGAPNQDATLKWLVGSPYWLLLDEYGIGNGTLAGSMRVPTSAVIQPGDVDGGLVDVILLQQRIAAAIHGDADASTSATVNIPGADAYVFYLPDGVNVALGTRGSYTYQTCIDSNGYHGHDGFEAYTVLPPCDAGRSLFATSHELTEMATDPAPYSGWASDIDIPTNGGEVADLCEQKVMQEGVIVTRLWSNLANGCVP